MTLLYARILLGSRRQARGATEAAGNQLDGNADGTGGDDLVVTEVAGKSLLVAIPGDADLDGVVTISVPNPVPPFIPLPGDGNILISNLNEGTGLDGHVQGEKEWTDGDFDGDGLVTISIPNPVPPFIPLPGDFNRLIANLGMSVVVPAPDSAATFAVSDASSAPVITTVEEISGPIRSARVYEHRRATSVEGAATLLDEPAVAQRGSRVRRASTREVDLAIKLVTDERDDEVGYRREQDRLADGRLDRAWDEGLLAVVSRRL